ncbi:hypothetical protein F5Y06DRAFT_275901 [Hypoxylon sp. FL0890]|nr:hypothetical protein F5Y06DRAFT_275901 [Hypoxylon sp. FL0890]
MFRRFRRKRVTRKRDKTKTPMLDDGTEAYLELTRYTRHRSYRPDEILRLRYEMMDHFENNLIWEFEKVLDSGAFGTTAVMRYWPGEIKTKGLRPTRFHRRVVLKRALSIQGEAELRNEITWLSRMRGAEHIVAIILSRDDPAPAPGATDGDGNTERPSFLRRLFQQPANPRRLMKRFDPRRTDQEMNLAGLAGYPLLVLEYLPNGTLGRIIDRAIRYNAHIPNRLLWSFFLCLVRACVAMAYPMNLPVGRPTALETIPTGWGDPIHLTHQSLHCDNVVLGAPDYRFPEHGHAPVVKMIDLGAAQELSDHGPFVNLEHVSRLMICLITKNREPNIRALGVYNDDFTLASEIVGPDNDEKYPLLDPDLRDLLARCMSTTRESRPGLQEMLRTVENAVKTKTPESFHFTVAPFEADAAIKIFLQRLVYDADIEPDNAENAGREAETENEPAGRGLRNLFGLLNIGGGAGRSNDAGGSNNAGGSNDAGGSNNAEGYDDIRDTDLNFGDDEPGPKNAGGQVLGPDDIRDEDLNEAGLALRFSIDE